MIPKRCFDIVGVYDESLPWAEDYDLVLRLAKNFEFRHLDQAINGYLTHEWNKINTILRKERLYYEALVTERYYRNTRHELDSETKKKVLSNLMRYYSLTGQFKKMLRYAISGLSPLRSMISSILKNRPIK